MIDHLVHEKYKDLEMHHIRMNFSSQIEDIGKLSIAKVVKVLALIVRVYSVALFKNIDYLYYPPAGPKRIPMLRDVAILVSCRWLFKGTIFHFHAGGISLLYPQLPRVLQFFYRLAYFKPDLSIITGCFSPRDDQFLQSLRSVEIPNCVPDQRRRSVVRDSNCPRILYVSALFRSKGILDLLTAACLIRGAGNNFRIDVLGGFESEEFHNECLLFTVKNGLQDNVFFHGVQTGDTKWEYYDMADIFCFPSYYESETFPLVLLEAMQFGLPSVSTRWRGTQSIVQEDITGFFVSPRSPDELADKLVLLLEDENLRKSMGQHARERYELKFCLQNWLDQMELAITSLSAKAERS